MDLPPGEKHELPAIGRCVALPMSGGAEALGRERCMHGVREQVEAIFPDGSKLVTVDEPIR